MLLLEAVNLTLKAMGESRIDALDDTHPQQADILQQIETTSLLVQSRGWWFNQRQVWLEPETAGPDIGKVLVPTDAKLVLPIYFLDRYVQPVGTKLVDIDSGIDRATKVYVKVRYGYPNASWDLIPESVQTYIAHRAALEFTSDFDADQLKLQTLQARTTSAYAAANSDNIRYAKFNFFEEGTTGLALAKHYGQRIRA